MLDSLATLQASIERELNINVKEQRLCYIASSSQVCVEINSQETYLQFLVTEGTLSKNSLGSTLVYKLLMR